MSSTETGTASDSSETSRATMDASPLIAGVYSNYPCVPRSGGGKIVPDAVVDLGKPGPIALFYQCSAFTKAANQGMKVEPLVNEQGDPSRGTAVFVNPANTHVPLLRRRVSPVYPLPEGQSTFNVLGNSGVNTDPNDSVTMAAVDISEISPTPKVTLQEIGLAANSGLYTEQVFVSSGHPQLISVSATAWSQKAGQHIGAQLLIDNQPNANYQVFANVTSQHMSLVGGDRVRSLPQGQHTLRLLPHASATIDSNDVWSITVMEFPSPSTLTQLLGNDNCKEQPGGGVIASAPYTSKGGTQLICLWVSAYAKQARRMISATVQVDDNPVGSVQIYPAIASSHMLLCGGDIAPGSIPAGQHTIQVIADDNTVTDVNDRISLTVLEVFR